MGQALRPELLSALQQGSLLRPIAERVWADHTLYLEMRGECVNACCRSIKPCANSMIESDDVNMRQQYDRRGNHHP